MTIISIEDYKTNNINEHLNKRFVRDARAFRETGELKGNISSIISNRINDFLQKHYGDIFDTETYYNSKHGTCSIKKICLYERRLGNGNMSIEAIEATKRVANEWCDVFLSSGRYNSLNNNSVKEIYRKFSSQLVDWVDEMCNLGYNGYTQGPDFIAF